MFELQRREIPPSRVQQRCRSGPPPLSREHPALSCLGTPARRPTPDSARILQNEKKVKEYWDINGNSRNH